MRCSECVCVQAGVYVYGYLPYHLSTLYHRINYNASIRSLSRCWKTCFNCTHINIAHRLLPYQSHIYERFHKQMYRMCLHLNRTFVTMTFFLCIWCDNQAKKLLFFSFVHSFVLHLSFSLWFRWIWLWADFIIRLLLFMCEQCESVFSILIINFIASCICLLLTLLMRVSFFTFLLAGFFRRLHNIVISALFVIIVSCENFIDIFQHTILFFLWRFLFCLCKFV